MIRLLGDEQFPVPIVDGARRLDPAVQFFTTHDLELDRTPDAQLLEWAADQGWVIVTIDKRTMVPFAEARIASGLPMPGLVFVTRSTSTRIIIEDLAIISVCADVDDVRNQIIHVPLR